MCGVCPTTDSHCPSLVDDWQQGQIYMYYVNDCPRNLHASRARRPVRSEAAEASPQEGSGSASWRWQHPFSPAVSRVARRSHRSQAVLTWTQPARSGRPSRARSSPRETAAASPSSALRATTPRRGQPTLRRASLRRASLRRASLRRASLRLPL